MAGSHVPGASMRRGNLSCSLLMTSEAHTGGRTDGANVTACTRPDKVRVELEEME